MEPWGRSSLKALDGTMERFTSTVSVRFMNQEDINSVKRQRTSMVVVWWCRPHPVREHAQDLRPPLGARPASPPTRQAAQPPPRGPSTNPRPLVVTVSWYVGAVKMMQRVMVSVVAKWAVCCWVVGRVYFV